MGDGVTIGDRYGYQRRREICPLFFWGGGGGGGGGAGGGCNFIHFPYVFEKRSVQTELFYFKSHLKRPPPPPWTLEKLIPTPLDIWMYIVFKSFCSGWMGDGWGLTD